MHLAQSTLAQVRATPPLISSDQDTLQGLPEHWQRYPSANKDARSVTATGNAMDLSSDLAGIACVCHSKPQTRLAEALEQATNLQEGHRQRDANHARHEAWIADEPDPHTLPRTSKTAGSKESWFRQSSQLNLFFPRARCQPSLSSWALGL